MADIMLKSLKFPGLPDKYLIPQIDNTLTQNGKAADAKPTGDRLTALETAMASKANVDGSYADMTAGNAEQLVSSIGEEDKVPYNFRTAGGAIDIGDRLTEKIVGGTVAWNQLTGYNASAGSTTINGVTFTVNADGSVIVNGTATANAAFNIGTRVSGHYGHKRLVIGCPYGGSGSTYRLKDGYGTGSDSGTGLIENVNNDYSIAQIIIANGYTANNLIFRPQIFDLTQMFGSTIADYLYSLEQANAGAGVAWFKKLFPKPYYPYNAGELMSVKTSAHKTVGFNAWDEEWESGYYDTTNGSKVSSSTWSRSKNLIPCVPNTNYYWYVEGSTSGNTGAILFYDANGNYIGYTTSSGGVSIVNTVVATPANCYFMAFYHKNVLFSSKICVNLAWDNSRNGEYEPYEENVYPLDSDLELRGIPKLDSGNNLYYDGDTYESDGTVTRRYGIVDAGTLSWTFISNSAWNTFYAGVPGKANGRFNVIMSKYSHDIVYNTDTDKIYDGNLNNTNVYVRDSSFNGDAAAFKTAVSGVYLIYELATPTTESADPYQNPQIVNDFGTEEYVDERTVAIPVGHESFYAANLKAKLEMAPDSPSDGDGDYIVRQTNGVNEYVPLVIPNELPDVPGTDGAYVLRCTINNGTATYSWVSAT